ncbi:MAG: hypothetical protein NVS1B7_2610 [Candidatus Saccharimonadales bacterium]
MIQFNLLPDIKLQYIKAKRIKRLVMLTATTISSVAVGVVILLFLVTNVWQARQLSSLSKNIKNKSDQLKSTPNLDKILTIQNQLNSLPKLHAQKPVVSRIFNYLSQVTPATVSISQLEVDYTSAKNTIVFTGNADTLESVNKFVDTLKFTTYSVDPTQQTTKSAFSNVVLAVFSRTDKGSSYTINAVFDPLIFDNSSNVTLKVPAIITTRSATESPTDLFQTNVNKPPYNK